MNSYIKGWKDLKNELGLKAILDGLLASFVFSVFIIVPTVLIYLQVISMYYHRLNLLVFLLTITMVFISAIQILLWKKALLLKKPDLHVDLKSLFYKQMVIHGMIIMVIGLLFILIWIPMLQV